MRTTTRRGIGIGLGLVLWAAGAVVVAGGSPAEPPSLTAKAVFGKAAYVSGERITARLTVHNAGSAAVHGITAFDEPGANALLLEEPAFGKLGTGATIPAGGSITVAVAGHLADPGASSVLFTGMIADHDGNGVADFTAGAPVTVRKRTVRGQVFADRNADGKASPGEGLSHARISFNYLYGDQDVRVTAGKHGRFSIVLPWAKYYVSGGTAHWAIIPRVTTARAHSPALTLRAVRPLTNVLTAAMRFTKNRYAVGDRAKIVVTLANTGGKLLRGIAPSCARAGDPDELHNTGRGWGRLAFGRSGVTLRPHSTRTFIVRARVPRAAQRAGQVVVACDFGYPGVETGYRPSAMDSARVPGEFGAFAVEVVHSVTGQPGSTAGLAGVRLVLADPTRCPVYRRAATTDANGRVRFGHVPAGASYQLYVFPPKGWKVRGANPTHAFVYGKDTIHFSLQAVPGSRRAPTVPKKCG